MSLMSIFKFILLIFIFFLNTSPALGKANLGVWPIKISLWPEKNINEIHLTNKGMKDVNVQIYAKSWDMDENGKFIEADSGDFVFYPRLLTIPASSDKVVRVGYNGDFPPLEKSYRLYIHELPQISAAKKEQNTGMSADINILMRLSLPLFVAPAKTAPAPRPTVHTFHSTTDGIKVAIKNNGSHHFMVQRLQARLLDSKGAVLTQGEASKLIARVLPHRQLFLDVPLDLRQSASAKNLALDIYLENSKHPIKLSLPIKGGLGQIQ